MKELCWLWMLSLEGASYYVPVRVKSLCWSTRQRGSKGDLHCTQIKFARPIYCRFVCVAGIDSDWPILHNALKFFRGSNLKQSI